MIRNIYDLAYPSGAVAAGLPEAFQSGPMIESFDAMVLDSRTSGSTGIANGKLWVEVLTTANAGDALYTPSATASQPLPLFSYGVQTSVPPPTAPSYGTALVTNVSTGQNQLRIRQKGTCFAYVLTTGTAAAAGTPLGADGAGNLTPIAGTVNGTCLAISKGALATAQAATLTLVTVGGY